MVDSQKELHIDDRETKGFRPHGYHFILPIK
jgi:hypothetical protein